VRRGDAGQYRRSVRFDCRPLFSVALCGCIGEFVGEQGIARWRRVQLDGEDRQPLFGCREPRVTTVLAQSHEVLHRYVAAQFWHQILGILGAAVEREQPVQIADERGP